SKQPLRRSFSGIEHFENAPPHFQTLSEHRLRNTQKELDTNISDLSDRIATIASNERDISEFESEISERIRQLENRIEHMEQPAADNQQRLDPPYPSFASFSLRAAVASVLFMGMFWTLYSQGTFGGIVFGALIAFLSVLGIASTATWYKLK
ncbi:hypothetical protein, partial [Halorubrum tebenquichense]|uniref:hypothetical protein n=1 Tax=Halorubrum tebenquichense TaxID=119434 RepID=UPI0019D3A7BB